MNGAAYYDPKKISMPNLKVQKSQFDAILGKLIATPPKPATPKRKARKAKRKAQ
jgi:hypothetical protein